MGSDEPVTHFGPIPWSLVRTGIRFVRKHLFSVSIPETDYLRTHADIDTVRTALGKRHFTNAWELSFHYHGEDLNMRRPEYDETDYRPWYQTHVRGFDQSDGSVALHAHYEYEPTAYPRAHLHTVNLNVNAGLAILGNVLDEADIDHELVLT